MKNFIKVRIHSLAMCAFFIATSNITAAELDENCVVNILNRTIQVAPNGGWSLPNVPSNQGAVRARATCIDDEGATVSGQSGYFNLITNGITPVGDIFFAEQEPVPSEIQFSASSQISLTTLNQNYQLAVTAVYPGGLMDDVTAALSGTNYTSSNSAKVSVSANGLLTALGSGNSLITANKDGVVATRLIKVSFTGDQDGDGLPDDYETDNGLDPTDPADAFEDKDNDGLSALDEYLAGTDLNNADTDDDGIDDFEELNEGEDGFVTNPLLTDSDADGLPDLLELTVGSSPIDGSDANYEDAISSITVLPSSVLMTFNGIDSEVSTQLTVTANLLGGEQLDVTAKSNGTSYSSSDLTVVSFGLSDGEIFGGEEGQTTVTVALFDLSVDIPVTVESFQPEGISSLQFTGTGKDTDVQGDYVYIAASSGGLHIVDASTKASPEIVSTFATSGTANDVKVVGTVAYVAVGNAGLDIVDISNPLEPQLLSNIKTSGSAVDLAVQNDTVFVAASSGGLDVISVQNSQAPVRLSKLDTLGNIVGVDVQNDKAVVATTSSVIVIDISDILSPMRLGSINIGNIRAVVMDGDYAYVACYTCGYKILNISNPQQPTIVGGDTRFYPSDVELTNGFAFFSDILFVNAVPFVNIANPEDSIFQGVIDIRQFGDRDAVGLSLDAGFVYSTGSNRLYISQYRILNDSQGLAPSVNIIDPLDGDVVVESSRVIVRAQATDDIAVAAVSFSVNGEVVFTDTTRPYEVPIVVPSDSDELNILVTAIDFGNNQGDNLALLMIEPDEDNDGLGDNEEVFTWNTDPEDSDSDDDNVLDGEEIELGTNPLDSDSDDDGISDGDEITAGTDPLNPDTTAPMVNSIEPAADATEVCENQSVVVTFNEALSRSSLNQTEIILSSDSEASVNGISSLAAANTQVIFNPSSLLKDNSDYQFSIANIRDEAGNLLAEPFISEFTTGNCVDLDRPTVIDISPINGAVNIPVNARISVTLSEPVDPLTVTEESFYVIDQSSNLRVNGVIELVDDNSAIQFTPNVPFLVGRRHYVYITSAILDLFENPLVGTNRRFDTAFDLDGDGPQIQYTGIQDGDAMVPVNAKISVLFNEAINALFLSDIKILDEQGAEVTVTRAQSADKRRIILSPLQNLNPDASYQFVIDGVQDLSANLLANPVTINFSTLAEADTEVGSVAAWSIPRNNTLNVALNPQLTVDLSEKIDPTTVNFSSFYLYDTQTRLRVSGQIEVSDDAMRLEYVPDDALKTNRRYYLYVGYSPYLTDLAGNFVAQNQSRYFSTGIQAMVDDNAQAVSATNINNGNTYVPINGQIELVFAQELGGQCDTSSAVSLMAGEVQIGVTTSLDNSRTILTINTLDNLEVSTEYQLNINGLCDFSGNELTDYSLAFTTTASEDADTTAPTLQSIVPEHRSTDISVNTQIVMNFDEAIDKRAKPLVKGGGITVPGTYVVDGNGITFTPDIELLGNTRYTVELHYNAADLAGNTRWLSTRYFDTQSTEDTQQPNILAVSPAADSTDVSPVQTIVVSFDEPMNLSTLVANNIALYSNGNVINPTISRSADGREISLSTTMPNASIISLVMTDAVTDLSGNSMTPFVVSFTTGVLDTDDSRPQIVGQIPANGSSNWSALNEVYFYTNEAVDEASLAQAFHLAENGILADVDIDVLGDGRTIKVSKDDDFVAGGLIQVYWDNNALDLAGNQLHAYNGYFNMADPNDGIGTRARINAYFPNSGTQGVPLNPLLMAQFNEPLDAASLTDERITLTDTTTNTSIGVNYELDESGQIILVTPNVNLDADHQYYLWFSVSILDDDGDNLAGNYATYFYTREASVEDDRQPSVISFTPPQDQTQVGVNTLFALSLDEQINPLSFNQEGAINVQFETGNTRVKYNKLVPLVASSEVVENAPEMKDLAGLSIVETSTTFTTDAGPDLIRPTVVDTAISNNQQNIALNPTLEWTFSEPIDPVSLNSAGVYLYDNFDRVTIGSSFELSGDGKKLTLMPEQALLIGRQYYQYVYGLRDLSGNLLGNHYRYFTTGFAEDVTPPQVTDSTVYTGLTGVPINPKLNLRFDEQVNPFDPANVSLTDASGDSVEVNISLSRNRTLLTIVPKQLLLTETDYRLEVSGMTDISGNEQASHFVAEFSTGLTADLISTGVAAWSLANNNTSNVPTNAWLQVNFVEPVDPSTVDSDTFYVQNTTANIRVAGSWTVADDRMSLRFIPDENLRENNVHYIYVGYSPYLTDWAGNRLAGNQYRYFTTGSGQDTSSPSITQTSLANGDQDVPVNPQIVIILDEPINNTCRLNSVVSLSSASGNVPISVSLSDANNTRKNLVVTVQENLATDTEYNLALTGLCDYAGNMLSQDVVSFTTSSSDIEDTQAPGLVSISPAHRATEVAVDLSEIVITYSETVDDRTAPPVVGAGITVPGDYSVNGNVVTFTPSIQLQGTTRYTVQLHSNATDLAGNVNWLSTRYFDTQDATDTDAPSVLAVSPAADSTDVSPNSSIVISFSEAMNPSTLSKGNLALFHNGSVINPNIFKSADGQQMTLSASLPANALISLVLTDGVTDLSSNAIAPFVSSFTTGPSNNDVARPRINTQVPANGSRDWIGLNEITFYASEPIAASSLENGLVVAENGIAVDIDLTLKGDGRTLIVSKTDGFAENARIDFYFNSSVTDTSGNAMHAYNGYLLTAQNNDGDGVRPRITAYHPNSGTRGLPLKPTLTASVNEPVDESSLTSETVILYNITNASAVLDTTISLDSTGTIIKVLPSENLATDNQYYLWFSASILDTDGDQLASNYATYFYTDEDSSADDRSPEVVAMSPPNGEINVGINALFAARFDEAINPLLFDTATNQKVGVQFSENNSVVKYNHLLSLPASSEITETLTGLTDLAGNLVADSSSTFTTLDGPDFVRPTLLDVAYANNQQNVPLSPVVEWIFSEPIDPVSVTDSGVYFYSNTDGENIASSWSLSDDGKRLTVMADELLEESTQYYVYAYYMRDLSGNTLGNHYRYFTTGFADDETGPVIDQTSIFDGQTDIPTNAKLNVRFNEMLSPTATADIRLMKAGEVINSHISLSRARSLLTLVPKSLLLANTEYTLIVSGVKDMSGNSQVNDLSISFTTGDMADLVQGSDVSWSIPNASQNVPLNPLLEVSLSERVDSTTVDSSSFYLQNTTANTRVAGSWSMTADGLRLTFTPDEALAAENRYYLYVGYSPYLTDLAGNRVAQNRNRYFNTGTEEDESSPAVAMSSIADSATDIPVNARVVIKLDERLSHACSPSQNLELTTGDNQVSASVELASDRQTVILTPQSTLAADTGYNLSILTLCDYAGNEITGDVLSFTTSTSADSDAVAPSLSAITPEHNATNIQLDSNIIIELDEAIDLRSMPPIKAGGEQVAGSYSQVGSTITFTPDENLAAETQYSIELYHNIPDFVGNTRNLSIRRFTTASE